MRAVWNGAGIAQSEDTIVVEGNHYFPPDSVRREVLAPSASHTSCPWKGRASYWSATVDGKTGQDVAWAYPEPKPRASEIAGYVTFWRGVRVETG